MQRCKWCNLDNPLYVKYHDEEWGEPTYDDKDLFELLILESYQEYVFTAHALPLRSYCALEVFPSPHSKVFAEELILRTRPICDCLKITNAPIFGVFPFLEDGNFASVENTLYPQ